MKLKIAGLFRSLLGKTDNSQPEKNSAPASPVANPSATPAQPQPAQAHASPNYYSSQNPIPPDPDHPDEIGISLVAIASSLPMDLKAKLVGNPAPGRMVYLPVEYVISQLAFGAVRISFGELRMLVPGIFVSNLNTNFDNRQVTLPLSEILARINPALLARRPATQKLEVAEDITGPFGGHGRGVTFSDQPLKGPVASPATPSRSVKPELPGLSKRDIKPAPVQSPSREFKPAAPVNLAPPSMPAPPRIPADSGRPSKNGNGNVIGRATDNGNGNGHGNGNGNGNGSGNGIGNGRGPGQVDKTKNDAAPVLPPFKFSTNPVPPPAAPARLPVAAVPPPVPSIPAPSAPVSMQASGSAPKRAAGPQPSFSVWLQELSEKWPNEVKAEIVAQGLANSKVPLPMSVVEPGLKRGRVTLAWRELRTYIDPNSPPSTVDDLELDLPLNVIAPGFLATQRKISAQAQAQAQERVAVSEEIPNLFFGFPQPETPAPPAPAAPAYPTKSPVSAPTPPGTTFRPNPLPRMAPASGEASSGVAPVVPLQQPQRSGDTNIFSPDGNVAPLSGDSGFLTRKPSPPTDFLSRQMQPKDVVAHALALPGVAGAVVALADGLRVAGQVPPEFNADTVAAFLPQIYERVNQCTRELRMGALNNVSFTVGDAPWKIFRVNSIYFAVFGRGDEQFPKFELAQLAAGLNRKSK
ncbi:MAG TPA: hypothetical protein VNZ25_02575 [Candidatus Angelobacter sp.]|nr:hypothetical protein [Candidatus Angelobacter sp.]